MPELSAEEINLKLLARRLINVIDNPIHDTRRYSAIYNLSYDIYRKSVETEPHIDPELIDYMD